jgi:hypothetical protein
MGVFSPVHRSIPVISISSLFLFSSAPHGREYEPKSFTKDSPEKQLFHTERLTFFYRLILSLLNPTLPA